jgi:hypothetical protein
MILIDQEKGFLRALVEFLFAVIIVLTVVVSVKEESKSKDESLQLSGRYLITIRWPQLPNLLQNDDVDAHCVQIETGEHSWYASPSSAKSYITMNSVDDTSSNFIYYTNIDTGKLILCNEHEERIVINTTVPGEIAVIVFMYNKRWSDVPTKVTVTLVDLLKNSQELIKEEVEMLYTGEQKTAFRFTLDVFGNIIPGSKNQIPYLIKDTKRAR